MTKKSADTPAAGSREYLGLTVVLLLSAFLHGCRSGAILLPDSLREVSGLYYAGPDSLWWHNDGGDRPRLILTDARGRRRREVQVPGALNRDWEDLTADKSGRLYIGDFGNNFNKRRDLVIYRFDPAAGALDSIQFRYPDQTEFPPPPARAGFDAEAFFWYRDTLHLFTKNRLWRGNYYTKHYVIPALPGNYTAALRDSLYLRKRVVTAAAVSPDGQAVALLSYWFKPLLGFIPVTRTSVFLLEGFPGTQFLRGTQWRRGVPKFLAPVQYEALDFINDETVMVASERTILFRQKARALRIKRKSGALP